MTNEIPYGNLYNWYAVQGRDVSLSLDLPIPYIYKNICPDGWHVPTDAEWTILTDTLGGLSVAGGKMKSTGTTYWSSESAGTDNSSGFSALPGGVRNSDLREDDSSFNNIRKVTFFWSATVSLQEDDDVSVWVRGLYNNNGSVNRYTNPKSTGGSVRCLLTID